MWGHISPVPGTRGLIKALEAVNLCYVESDQGLSCFFTPVISMWKACRGAHSVPVEHTHTHTYTSFIAPSRAHPSATEHAHTSSAHSTLSPALGTGGQALEQHACSVYGIGGFKVHPLGTWPLLPQDSISVEKPMSNLGFLGSCQAARHGTFLSSPPCKRKASFCSTSRKLNQRKLPNPIATDCPGCSQMVIINDASGSFLPCFTD